MDLAIHTESDEDKPIEERAKSGNVDMVPNGKAAKTMIDTGTSDTFITHDEVKLVLGLTGSMGK
ncbi:hypothetical protein CCACVL1_04304 [Corchorus capsularis]|uniref:Peptidase A2 domain-containing protein n=1 Tax=Corchorus capsularis TaxID=210143 RepID=A0A1R3JTH7_COCAP|nr:hypothetical protein CCACVL1_04304 [Corchorus capsularis]